jgi:hypothetical protein
MSASDAWECVYVSTVCRLFPRYPGVEVRLPPNEEYLAKKDITCLVRNNRNRLVNPRSTCSRPRDHMDYAFAAVEGEVKEAEPLKWLQGKVDKLVGGNGENGNPFAARIDLEPWAYYRHLEANSCSSHYYYGKQRRLVRSWSLCSAVSLYARRRVQRP